MHSLNSLFMCAAEERFISSGEVRLWSERIGSPDDPAILLIMGTSAQGIGWPDELVDVLVAGGRQVIRFDHRDTGRSTCVDFAARPYALADMAADAAAVLDGHRVAAAHIAGASLGGAIGQWLALHRPERVLGLTAIMTGRLATAPDPRGRAPWPGRTQIRTISRRRRRGSCGTWPSGRPLPARPARG